MKHMIPNDHPVSERIQGALENVAEMLDSWDELGVYQTSVTEIPYEAYDGFIPYTNGGWEGIAHVRFQEAKDHFSSIKEYADRDFEMLMEEFRDETRKELDDDGVLDETVFDALSDDKLRLFFEEEYENFATEWEQADSDVFFLKFRAHYFAADNHRNETGEDEVFFFACVNTDFNYGRDHISWIPKSPLAKEWTETVKVSDCTPDKTAEIEKAMREFFNHA